MLYSSFESSVAFFCRRVKMKYVYCVCVCVCAGGCMCNCACVRVCACVLLLLFEYVCAFVRAYVRMCVRAS